MLGEAPAAMGRIDTTQGEPVEAGRPVGRLLQEPTAATEETNVGKNITMCLEAQVPHFLVD